MSVEVVHRVLEEAASVVLAARACADEIVRLARSIGEAFMRGNKVVVFGNGGSASDAQHFVGELVGRFKLSRAPLPAISLTADTAVLTALANDFGFENSFSKQVEAIVSGGDVVIGISTSGASENVLRALRMAKHKGAVTALITGMRGEHLRGEFDACIVAPSEDTQRIQEVHGVILHIICELVERRVCEG